MPKRRRNRIEFFPAIVLCIILIGSFLMAFALSEAMSCPKPFKVTNVRIENLC